MTVMMKTDAFLLKPRPSCLLVLRSYASSVQSITLDVDIHACVIWEKSCKGGASVTSPDFEVGGKEGGKGLRRRGTECISERLRCQLTEN
ncbi:uncharacterized protein V6R79_003259 [Siganus canaliculatus]